MSREWRARLWTLDSRLSTLHYISDQRLLEESLPLVGRSDFMGVGCTWPSIPRSLRMAEHAGKSGTCLRSTVGTRSVCLAPRRPDRRRRIRPPRRSAPSSPEGRQRSRPNCAHAATHEHVDDARLRRHNAKILADAIHQPPRFGPLARALDPADVRMLRQPKYGFQVQGVLVATGRSYR